MGNEEDLELPWFDQSSCTIWGVVLEQKHQHQISGPTPDLQNENLHLNNNLDDSYTFKFFFHI